MALTGIQIYHYLPQTNCKACGWPTCMVFAIQVAAKQQDITDCPYVSNETIHALAESSGRAIKPIENGKAENPSEAGQEAFSPQNGKKIILIGERINPGFKDIQDAIIHKHGEVIQKAAKRQAEAKADYIDVNLGMLSDKPEDLCWLVEMVQEAVDAPIAIDHPHPAMIKAALAVCKKPPLINATTAEEDKLNELLPLAVEHNASIIGLVVDESGSPKTAEKRIDNAGKIVAKALEYGLPPEHLFLDPIVMPVKYMQDQAQEVLRAINQFQYFIDPPCHIVAGLSNISNNTKHKKLINHVFCAMLIAHGLDAVILDVTDKDLVHTIRTAELIMNRTIYTDSYLETFKI